MGKFYVKILLLAPLFVLSACHNSDNGNVKYVNKSYYSREDTFDTLRVIGVYSYSYRSMYRDPEAYKCFRCVNKKGCEMDVSFYVLEDRVGDTRYIQRGDTIVMQGKQLVINLTQKRIKEEFVDSRY